MSDAEDPRESDPDLLDIAMSIGNEETEEKETEEKETKEAEEAGSGVSLPAAAEPAAAPAVVSSDEPEWLSADIERMARKYEVAEGDPAWILLDSGKLINKILVEAQKLARMRAEEMVAQVVVGVGEAVKEQIGAGAAEGLSESVQQAAQALGKINAASNQMADRAGQIVEAAAREAGMAARRSSWKIWSAAMALGIGIGAVVTAGVAWYASDTAPGSKEWAALKAGAESLPARSRDATYKSINDLVRMGLREQKRIEKVHEQERQPPAPRRQIPPANNVNYKNLR